MSLFTPAGGPESDPLGLVVPHRDEGRVARVLAFCGLTRGDLARCPVARERVRFYLGVDRELARRGEVLALERQWNPLGRP